MSYVYVSAFAGNLVSFSVGTSLTWSSPISSKLQDADETPFDRTLTNDETSWISSLLALGAVFGPFIFGYLADKIGRKYTLLACGAPLVAFYLLLAFCNVPSVFYVSRFIIGLSVGGVFTVMPMYVGEIADDANRGALGSAMNCFLCTGILFSYSLGPYVSVMAFNMVLAIFPALFLVAFLILAPETAHYYVSRGKDDLAEETLMKIRGGDSKRAETELSEIQRKLQEEGSGTFLDIFRSKATTKAFIISTCLVAFQQLSGINAVLFYAQSIFQQAGTSLEPAVCSIIVGGVQFGTSFITPLVVDRLGRKLLLLISAIGMIVAEVPLGVYSFLKDQDKDVSSIGFLPILCLISYIIMYNNGFGPLPWAVMGELFPTNVKSIASSATTAVCWFIGFIIAKYFQSMSDAIGMGASFWIFAGFCVISIPFCLLYVVETKGKSLQEIQEALNS